MSARVATLVVAIALSVAQTAQADWWAWIGKDNSTSPCYYDDFGKPANGKTNGCWYRSGSTGLEDVSFENYNHWIGFTNSGKLTIDPKWDGTITFRTLTKQTGGDALTITEYANPITFVSEGKNPEYGISSDKSLKLDLDVELKILSGSYRFYQISVANSETKGKSKLTVDGSGTSLESSHRLSLGYDSSTSEGSTGHLVVGDGATVKIGENLALYKGDVAINGGSVSVGGTLHIAYRGSGEFTLNSGEVDVANEIRFGGHYAVDPTKLNLNGGTLTAPTIVWHNGNTTVSIVFNGGTLKAKCDGVLIEKDDKIAVSVGEGGGSIDNGGYDISIPNAISGTGGMIFKGEGSTTLSGRANYSGQTAITPGTKLVTGSETSKNNILNKGLVIAGIPTEGDELFVYTKGDGNTISDDQLAKVTCPLAPTTMFELGEGKTNIVVKTVGQTLDNYWTGAANDGDLSNASNWKSGVPTLASGTAYIFCATNSTLTKGDVFAPQSITFLGGSAAVTINGDFSGITQIANNSSSKVEFKDAVAFFGDIDVVQNTGAVKFTGGATGTQLARATDIHGIYNFTKEGDLTEIANTTVKSDGVYNLRDGTFCKTKNDSANFHVDEDGKAVVKNAKILEKTGGAKLLGVFNGEFWVEDEFLVDGNGAGSYQMHYMCDSGNGTFIVNKLRMTSRACILPATKTIIGKGGIMREGSGYVRVPDSGSCEIGSYADWAMYYNQEGNNTTTYYYSFYKAGGSSTLSTIVFDTTDYVNSTIGRTIRCEAPIGGDNATYAGKLSVTVKGKGTFIFANTYSNEKVFSGGLTVTNTATVKVNAGCVPGIGAVTLSAGTTLALTAESREFTPLANTLNLPTEGTATLRIDGKRLRSGKHVIAQSVTGASENIKLDEKECEAVGGRKFTLSIDDDEGLVLNIVSDGTMIIVR